MACTTQSLLLPRSDSKRPRTAILLVLLPLILLVHVSTTTSTVPPAPPIPPWPQSNTTPPVCYHYIPSVCMFCDSNDTLVRNDCFHNFTSAGRYYATFRWEQENPHFNTTAWYQQLHNTTFRLVQGMLSLDETGKCPLYATGRFVEEPCTSHLLRNLGTPAWAHEAHELYKQAPEAYCKKHCCSLKEFLNGTFSNAFTGKGSDWPLEHIWHTHSGCVTHSYRPMAAIPCLHAKGVARIVLIGDSMLRQWVGRFVSHSRLSQHTVDAHVFQSLRYRIWPDQDLFEIGTEGQKGLTILMPHTRHRFRLAYHRRNMGSEPLPDPLLDVVSLWAPQLDHQIKLWQDFDNVTHEQGGLEKSIIVTGIWAWHHGIMTKPELRQPFDQLLALISKPRPWIHRTYIVNSPTGKVPLLADFQDMNAHLKQVTAATPHLTLLDFEAISRAQPHAPPQLDFPPQGDAHYGCEMSGLRDRTVMHGIVMNTHGGCTDTANTVLLQALLNDVCSPGFH